MRGHSSIENKLRGVRDVTYDEDRTGSGPQVMATLRDTAVSLHHRASTTNITRACRRLAAHPGHALNLVLQAEIPTPQRC